MLAPRIKSGGVPAIHFRHRDGPEGDARNKSGHDDVGAGMTEGLSAGFMARALLRASNQLDLPPERAVARR